MLSQSPPRKLRSVRARCTELPDCPSGAGCGTGRGKGGEGSGDGPDARERDPDADSVGDRAEHGPQDGAEDRGGEGGADSSPRRSRGVATVSQAKAPAQVIVLEAPWTNRASPSAHGPSAAANAKLASSEQREAGDDRTLRPAAHRRETAGNAAEQRARAEGADEQSGAGLREPELVGIAGIDGASAPNNIVSTNTTA